MIIKIIKDVKSCGDCPHNLFTMDGYLCEKGEWLFTEGWEKEIHTSCPLKEKSDE